MNETTSSQIRIIAGLLAAGFLVFAFQNCGRPNATSSEAGGLGAGLTADAPVSPVQAAPSADYIERTQQWKSPYKAISLFKPNPCTDTGTGDFCEQVIVDKTYSTGVETFVDAEGFLWVQNACGSFKGTLQPRTLGTGETISAGTAAIQVVGMAQQTQLSCALQDLKDSQEVAYELSKATLLREISGGLEVVTVGGARLGLQP